ncbi:replicative DNA helicase [uncultured Oscillibacter sp.]|uniref:replicative DNA helicase n=1 Tax=uncultured Oscillibacter sp. TaxID=876091 RepID=UPI002632A0D1|nr:replicative DNA helicase [uncultured Oscillibacter sp.]
MALKDSRPSLEAEQAVVGSLLVAGAKGDTETIRGLLSQVREEDLLNPVNKAVFQAARALFRSGAAVDPITIRDRIGGQYSDYLVQLMDITPTTANWAEWARAAHEQSAVQRARALAEPLSLAVTLDDCRPVSAQLGQLLSDGRRLNTWTVSQLLDSFFESQDPEAPKPEYVTFGLRVLDEGSYIEPGDVVIIGGYPSDGKTALALQTAWHMATKYRVGFFSLETDRRKLRDRLVAHAAGLDLADIKRRDLGDAAWEELAKRQADFVKRDLTLVDAAGMSAADIETASRAYGFQVIFIDYIQLVTPERSSGGTRSEQIAAISRALHTFAQKTGTLVVELAQLTRQERKTDKYGNEIRRDPTMQDLKESGQLEQDADMILLLFRPGPKDKGPDGQELNAETHRLLKIAKNKEGRWGNWVLYFDGGKQTLSVVTDNMGVMRKFQAEGRKAQIRSRRDPNQVEFTELPGGDKDLPF